MKSISLDSPEPHFDENACLKGRNLSVPRVVESYHHSSNNTVETNRRVHNSWVNLVRNRMHLNSSSRQQLRLNCNEMGAANSAPASYNHCNFGPTTKKLVCLFWALFSSLCDCCKTVYYITSKEPNAAASLEKWIPMPNTTCNIFQMQCQCCFISQTPLLSQWDFQLMFVWNRIKKS